MPAFELLQNPFQSAVIKVIGVGGGGGNAISYMASTGLSGIEFIAANTDAQALNKTNAHTLLQLGSNLTRGLGAGANPEVGRQAAIEDRDRIREFLTGTDMLFITAGMGGGTGTGAAPVIAEIAKEMSILTVAIVSRPFAFEGKKREASANSGLKLLSEYVDSLITIPNERLLTVLGKNATFEDACKAANNVLYGAVQGISELITSPGFINVDFADVRTVMGQQGLAMMGTGRATGENRAQEAAKEAIASPLLDNINLAGARAILVNITSNNSMTVGELNEVGEIIREFASEDAIVIIGTAFEESLGDELRITIVATGLGQFADNSLPFSQSQPRRRSAASLLDDANSTSAATPVSASNQKRGSVNEQEKLFNEILDIPAFLRKQAD